MATALQAAQQPVSSTYHGETLSDPYRWMEAVGPAFLDWVHAQNAVTRAMFAGLPGYSALAKHVAAASDAEIRVSNVQRVGGALYFERQGAGQAQASLFVRPVAGGAERRLVDPVKMADATTAITDYAVSADNRMLAFSLSGGGSEEAVLHVMRLATGEVLPGRIDRARAAGPVWSDDGATAADGTKIPVSVVHLRGMKRDGSAPALVDAYGAYGTPNDAYFHVQLIPFLRRGGVYAVPHVRGGGEYGEAWHLAGKGAAKPNTWRDYIASIGKLEHDGFTSRPKLVGLGASAGGIMIGRAITERPDLLAGAVMWAPVSNTLRFETTEGGPANTAEFGSVATPDGYTDMLAFVLKETGDPAFQPK